jgi:hypothetical protein
MGGNPSLPSIHKCCECSFGSGNSCIFTRSHFPPRVQKFCSECKIAENSLFVGMWFLHFLNERKIKTKKICRFSKFKTQNVKNSSKNHNQKHFCKNNLSGKTAQGWVVGGGGRGGEFFSLTRQFYVPRCKKNIILMLGKLTAGALTVFEPQLVQYFRNSGIRPRCSSIELVASSNRSISFGYFPC